MKEYRLTFTQHAAALAYARWLQPQLAMRRLPDTVMLYQWQGENTVIWQALPEKELATEEVSQNGARQATMID